jgi:DNA-binding response OmpR family regulator
VGAAAQTVRVLVVDDSISVQHAVRDAFGGEPDWEVDICGDAEEAEVRFAARPPHLVFCDVVLPGRSGYDLCRALKARLGVPVVLLSGGFEPFDRDRAAAAGADGVLQKPFAPEEIRARARAALASRPGGDRDTAATGPAGVVDTELPEITEADLVTADAGAADVDEMVRRLVAPLCERLVGPLSDRLVRGLEERLIAALEDRSGRTLDDAARQAIRDAAERQVGERLREIETGGPAPPAVDPGPPGRAS